MNTSKVLALLGSVLLFSLAQSKAAPASPPGRVSDPSLVDEVALVLASVPVPELAPMAGHLVTEAKTPDRESTALAAVQYVGTTHPGSIAPVVGAVIAALPDSAAQIVVAAVRLVPSERDEVSRVALQVAPGQAKQVTDALANKGNSGADNQPGNRPVTPPGLVGKTVPGTIRGNRPTIPPGLVREPKPGRGPQRYGSP